MFTGTRRVKEDVAKVLKRMGVNNATASTDHDRTRVMMDVPEASFDAALRLVAELMAGTVEALTEEKVDKTRREIEQEVARNDNSPYIFAEDLLRSRIYPAGASIRSASVAVDCGDQLHFSRGRERMVQD